MARLIAALIRHGDYHQLPDTPSAHQPFPLTVAGRKQVSAAAGALRETITRNGWQLVPGIDTSRMLRAWQTAVILAEQLDDLPPSAPLVESFDALAERGLGSAANLTQHQISLVLQQDPRYPDLPAGWKADSQYRLPLQGAESLLEAGTRVATHLQERMAALGEPAGDCLKLFVGHGAAFRHAAYHLGVLPYEQLAQLSMYHGQPVFLESRSGNPWRHIGGDWKQRAPRGEEVD